MDFDTKIQTVFLDAGGVLVWPNWKRVADALQARGISVRPEQLVEADPIARFSLDEAQMIGASTDQRRSTSFFDLVLLECGIEPSEATIAALADIRAYHEVHNLWEEVPAFVRPALQHLRSAGYRLVVVSNANGTLHKLFDRLGLAAFFDVMLDSHIEGVEKPDRRFFDLAVSRSGAVTESTVHVGDFYNVDVAGARSAGIKAVLVDEAGLHAKADCPRIRSIAELPQLLAAGI